MDTYAGRYLEKLEISSAEEAAVLEEDLNVRFDEFTDADVRTWTRQTRYLQDYAKTRAATSAAQAAGVSVYLAQAWERNDTLGFTRRLEMADLEFCDRIMAKALDLAFVKSTSPVLLARVLELHFPPDRTSNEGDDNSPALEVLRLLRAMAQQDMPERNAGASQASSARTNGGTADRLHPDIAA